MTNTKASDAGLTVTTLTRDEAIDRLVEQDVARWGEHEREAARTLHGRLSHGLAVNALAARAELADSTDATALRAAADAALTAADWRVLRQGG